MGLKKIEQFRKEKGITQKELSLLSGVPLGTLTKIITGETSDPKLETIKAITRALGCTLDELGDEITDSDYDKASPVGNVSASDGFIRIHDGVISKYDKLSEEHKKIIDNNIEYLLYQQDKEGEK